MSAALVSTLRARPEVVRLSGDGPAVTLRVQVAEAWDTVRVDAPADAMVVAVKQAALDVLMPDVPHHEDFVTKLGGWEVLDEHQTITAAGVRDGSTLLLQLRRRRPIR